jgi:hypothetical protein
VRPLQLLAARRTGVWRWAGARVRIARAGAHRRAGCRAGDGRRIGARRGRTRGRIGSQRPQAGRVRGGHPRPRHPRRRASGAGGRRRHHRIGRRAQRPGTRHRCGRSAGRCPRTRSRHRPVLPRRRTYVVGQGTGDREGTHARRARRHRRERGDPGGHRTAGQHRRKHRPGWHARTVTDVPRRGGGTAVDVPHLAAVPKLHTRILRQGAGRPPDRPDLTSPTRRCRYHSGRGPPRRHHPARGPPRR